MLIQSQNWGDDVAIDSSLVKKNLDEVKHKIAHYNIKIIAVTKYFGLNAIKAGFEVGIRDFAESRALEAIEKIESLPEKIQKESVFHFIGHLQSNKVEKVVRHFDIIHSVDSLKIAKKISDTACSLNKREKILLQVNNAGEEQKSGYTKEQLKQEFAEIISLKGLQVLGLMNMAPYGAEEKELKFLFGDIRQFRDELQEEFKIALPELSMGMSDDYVIAAQEGATMIRLGRKLFT